jgi:hypothetical protein
VYFNPEHRWSAIPITQRCTPPLAPEPWNETDSFRHFLDNMTDGEPLIFVSYDSMAGTHARCELFPILLFQAFSIPELSHFACTSAEYLSCHSLSPRDIPPTGA